MYIHLKRLSMYLSKLKRIEYKLLFINTCSLPFLPAKLNIDLIVQIERIIKYFFIIAARSMRQLICCGFCSRKVCSHSELPSTSAVNKINQATETQLQIQPCGLFSNCLALNTDILDLVVFTKSRVFSFTYFNMYFLLLLVGLTLQGAHQLELNLTLPQTSMKTYVKIHQKKHVMWYNQPGPESLNTHNKHNLHICTPKKVRL